MGLGEELDLDAGSTSGSNETREKDPEEIRMPH